MSTQTSQNPVNNRILVIDDNVAIHEDFKKIFAAACAPATALDEAEAALFGARACAEGTGGYALDSAHQGQEGFERAREAAAAGRPYAVAFVDVRMPPGWDGIETTARMWEVDPDLQVVICTAYSDYTLEEMLKRLGRTDRMVILKKPFDNVEVLQMANAMAEKWRLLQASRARLQQLEAEAAFRSKRLRGQEELFRLITTNMADLVAVVDSEGRKLYGSPSYAKVLGPGRESGGNPEGFMKLHPDDCPRVVEALNLCSRTGEPQALEYRARHQDGSFRDLEALISSVAAPAEGGGGLMVVVARDVTERKRSERERQMMEVQLRQAQKLESIGQLAAGIAHEINTPTQYVGDNTRFVKDGFAELLRLLNAYEQLEAAARAGAVLPEALRAVEAARQAADIEYLAGEIPKAIEQSLEGVERVARIVRAMKEFSHPGSAEKTLVNLGRAIESTLTVARNEWKYVADLVTDFDPELPAVPVLPGEFNQVVLNLVINATHAIADVVGDGQNGKGTITIRTRREGDWAVIRIEDTGGGIPEAVRGRIFDPFFTTKPVGKGTGQGLAIARSVVVNKHGGEIGFESELGRGTVFVIRLPLAGGQAETAEREAA